MTRYLLQSKYGMKYNCMLYKYIYILIPVWCSGNVEDYDLAYFRGVQYRGQIVDDQITAARVPPAENRCINGKFCKY